MPHHPPPLSPVLLLGLPLSLVPRRALDLVLADVMRLAARRHPRLLDRLAPLNGAHVLIEPSDLPVRFSLRFVPGTPILRIADEETPSAVVRGPLADLLALLEGRLDGDALFFARQLSVEGDTETIVTLRNALEGEEIDLMQLLLERAGPFGALVRAGAGPVQRVYRALESALAGAQQVLEAPLRRDLSDHDRRLSDLAARLGEVERETARRRR